MYVYSNRNYNNAQSVCTARQQHIRSNISTSMPSILNNLNRKASRLHNTGDPGLVHGRVYTRVHRQRTNRRLRHSERVMSLPRNKLAFVPEFSCQLISRFHSTTTGETTRAPLAVRPRIFHFPEAHLHGRRMSHVDDSQSDTRAGKFLLISSDVS